LYTKVTIKNGGTDFRFRSAVIFYFGYFFTQKKNVTQKTLFALKLCFGV